MSDTDKDDPTSGADTKEYVIPQGYSWYGISSGHSVPVDRVQSRNILKDFLFGVIIILGVILLLLILYN